MLFFMLACLILTGCMVFLVFATVQVLRAERPRRYGLLALYIVLLVALGRCDCRPVSSPSDERLPWFCCSRVNGLVWDISFVRQSLRGVRRTPVSRRGRPNLHQRSWKMPVWR